MAAMSGIEAGWAEHRGEGVLAQTGRKVTYTRHDGFVVEWPAHTDKAAASQLRLFRAATNHPETRPTVDAWWFNNTD